MGEAAKKAVEKAERKEERKQIKEERRRVKEHLKAATDAARKAKELERQKASRKLVKQATASPEQKTRVRRVGVQSLLYCVVFLITYSWTTVLIVYYNSAENVGNPELESDVFPFMLLRSIFIPFMGLWNLLVYVRPRYLTLRGQEEAKEYGESSWTSFRRVLWDVNAGIVGRGTSHRSRFAAPSQRVVGRFGSTKTQYCQSSGATQSSVSTLGSTNSTIPKPAMIAQRGNSAESTVPALPTFDRGGEASLELSKLSFGPPSTILERGESQHTQIGMSRNFFAQDVSQDISQSQDSFSSFASFGGPSSTTLQEPSTRRSYNFSQSADMTSLTLPTEREDSCSLSQLDEDSSGEEDA